MEKNIKLGITQAIIQGYQIKVRLRDGLINIQLINKSGSVINSRTEKPSFVDGKLEGFGEWIDWSKLSTGHIFKVVKNPTSNISLKILTFLHDKVVDSQKIAISIFKTYERKYL